MTAGAAWRSMALLCVVAVLGGCTGAAAPASGPQAASGDSHRPLVSVDGGSATMAVDTVPTTLNDHTVAGDNADTQAVASLVWPQVFRVSPGVAPVLDTDVIESAEVVSLAPQTVVYQINPAAQWSDGTHISAQDFVYSWVSQSGSTKDVDGNPDSVASSAGYDDITSVVGSDGGSTVTVVFRTPFADWKALFDDLLPAHVAERAGWNSGFDRFDPTVLVSGGPWVVSSWTPGQRMVLVHNPHWWAQPPRLDKLVIRSDPGAPAMAQALRSGEAQVAAPTAFDPTFEAQVSSSPNVESMVQLGTTVLQLEFNVRHAPLDAAGTRQGIAHLVDRADMASTLLQPLDPLLWEDNDHLFSNSDSWYSDDANGYDQPDAPTAARDLTAAGLEQGPQGTWQWHGAPLQLTFVWATDDPWSAEVGPAVAAQLVSAGFDVSEEPVTGSELYGNVLPGGAFDLALVPLTTGAYPSQLASAFGSAGGGHDTVGRDWSGFDDPKIDALFTQASQELAAAGGRGLYQQIDSDLWAAMPTLPLFAEPVALAWSASLTGVKGDPGGLGPLWSASKWAMLVPATTTSRGADSHRPLPGGGGAEASR